MFTFNILALLAVSAINFVLGAFIILRGASKKLNVSFSVLIFSIAFWSLGLGFFLASNNSSADVFWARVYYTAPLYIAWAAMYFAINFPIKLKSFVKNFHPLVQAIPIILYTIVLTLFDGFLIRDILFVNGSKTVILGKPEYFVYSILFISYFFYGIWILFLKYKAAFGVYKVQLFNIFSSLLTAGIFGVFFNLLLPWLGNYRYIWVGPQFSIIIIITIAYSIVRYRFLDTKFFIGKSLYYFFMALLPYTMFFTFAFIYENLWGTSLTQNAFIVSVFGSGFFVLLYDVYGNQARSLTENNFIYSRANPLQLISEYIESLNSTLDIKDINNLTFPLIKRTLNTPEIGLFYYYKKSTTHLYAEDVEYSKKEALELFEKIKDFWQKKHYDILIYDEIQFLVKTTFKDVKKEALEILKILKEMGIRTVSPLVNDRKLVGVILLGDKLSESKIYTQQDIDFINLISNNLSLTLKKTYLFNQVETFNKTLKTKIDKATSQIKNQRDKLQEALIKEKDMVDILGHELRTPLSTTRNAISMIKTMIHGGDFDKTKLTNYVDMAGRNIEREIDLLELMLTSAKIDNLKLKISFSKVDIKQLIEDTIAAYKDKIKIKGLSISFIPEKGVDYFVYADKIRLIQVINNLVDNAYKYTEKGTISISLAETRNKVKLTVKDSGVGIAKEDIDRIGEKFFRSNSYIGNKSEENEARVVRPGGSGLGLYVTFSLIKLMKGKVDIKSELNKGTSFEVTLDRFTNQHIDEDEVHTVDLIQRKKTTDT